MTLGQQVGRDVGGAVTLSVHDLAGSRIAEHDGAGAVIREYIWLDGRPLAVVEGGQTFWLHWDHILRPVLATDAAGSVVWAARYLPFGGIDQVSVDTGVLEQNLRFPGQWLPAGEPDQKSLQWSDFPANGLHQNWMRDYDPTTGRYLEADPLGLVDGPSVYGYARQSPVRYVDPRGENPGTAIGAEIGSIGGPLGALGGAIIGTLAGIVGYEIYQYCTSDGNACPPCKPYSAGTIGYIGPRYDHGHHPVNGPHVNLFQVNQRPDCKCFWNKISGPAGVAPVPPAPLPGWVDLNSGFPILSP